MQKWMILSTMQRMRVQAISAITTPWYLSTIVDVLASAGYPILTYYYLCIQIYITLIKLLYIMQNNIPSITKWTQHYRLKVSLPNQNELLVELTVLDGAGKQFARVFSQQSLPPYLPVLEIGPSELMELIKEGANVDCSNGRITVDVCFTLNNKPVARVLEFFLHLVQASNSSVKAEKQTTQEHSRCFIIPEHDNEGLEMAAEEDAHFDFQYQIDSQNHPEFEDNSSRVERLLKSIEEQKMMLAQKLGNREANGGEVKDKNDMREVDLKNTMEEQHEKEKQTEFKMVPYRFAKKSGKHEKKDKQLSN